MAHNTTFLKKNNACNQYNEYLCSHLQLGTRLSDKTQNNFKLEMLNFKSHMRQATKHN